MTWSITELAEWIVCAHLKDKFDPRRLVSARDRRVTERGGDASCTGASTSIAVRAHILPEHPDSAISCPPLEHKMTDPRIAFKAGRCFRRENTSFVDAEPTKGAIILQNGEDGLLHFIWKNRSTDAIVEVRGIAADMCRLGIDRVVAAGPDIVPR